MTNNIQLIILYPTRCFGHYVHYEHDMLEYMYHGLGTEEDFAKGFVRQVENSQTTRNSETTETAEHKKKTEMGEMDEKKNRKTGKKVQHSRQIRRKKMRIRTIRKEMMEDNLQSTNNAQNKYLFLLLMFLLIHAMHIAG